MCSELGKIIISQGNSSNKGFTFLELMISLTIFIIIVLGTSNMIINVERNVVTARKNTLACSLCQSKIEELKSFGYKAAVNSIEKNIDERGKTGGVFNREVKVSIGPIPNTKLITVTVSWNDAIRTQRVSFPTILANISI